MVEAGALSGAQNSASLTESSDLVLWAGQAEMVSFATSLATSPKDDVQPRSATSALSAALEWNSDDRLLSFPLVLIGTSKFLTS